MVLERLRRETAMLHRAVEARVDLLSESLTVERYVRILQVFQAFFSKCEDAVDAACPEEYGSLWKGRRRATRLCSDLRALAAAPDPGIACAFTEDSLSDAGEWLGALYVLEGSALGGQVISRHIEKHFGWTDGHGYTFFQGHGESTGARWKEVCVALEAQEEQCNRIVHGAHRTFHTLGVLLEASL